MMEKPLSKEIGLWVRFIHGLDWGSQSESQPLTELKIECSNQLSQPQPLPFDFDLFVAYFLFVFWF